MATTTTAIRGRNSAIKAISQSVSAVAWRLGTVTELIEETPHPKGIVLDVPSWPRHIAGQHVDVRMTAEDGSRAQ